ncbi:hypothetical protein ACFV0T_26650 [Streptomyces sp. NPDC059582]|uniref:zinc finger domain-containing protein n=1 Tax=Streptomyces sp. NPDC059582 TaxID=3346875 RepID=UPI0036B253EB
MSRRTTRYSSGGRTTASSPRTTPVKKPTTKQMQSVDCPACNAPTGTPCTLQGGHRARADAYQASTSTKPPAQPASKPNGRARADRACVICRKPLGKQPTAKAKSGKTCHASCLKRAQQAGSVQPSAPREWNTAAAEREFARNKARVEDGVTFRARQSTGWRLGGSPSTAGEIKR